MKIYNRKEQKILRQRLRNERSYSEKLLWYKIRNSNLGHKFRRQHGISNYVVDFYCPRLKLIIEVDGVTHQTKKEIEYDIVRQKFLENLGLTVKRYKNIDIKNNINGVLEDLQIFISKLE